MTKIERENIAVGQRLFNEVWNDRRIETIQEIFTSDAVFYFEHEEIIGFNGWKERLYDPIIGAIPDFSMEIEDIIAHGNYVFVRWKLMGHHSGELLGVSPTGEMMELDGISWLVIVDGKIVKAWNRWNMSYLLRQLVSEINTLRSIVPICSYCRKLRNDDGYWSNVEQYFDKHTNAQLSHGICQECFEQGVYKED
jgi:steroid delta-isomerase-like uncharacterized protein